MSLNLITEDEPVAQEPGKKPIPVKSIIILMILIFLAEVVTMIILYYLQLSNYIANMFLDGFIMVLMIFPALYLFQLKPLLVEIEERTLAEKALRSHEQLLQRILELLPVGVWITDKNGKVLKGNLASQEIWQGARYVGMEQYSEYKAWWADSGEPLKTEDWAAAKAIAQGATILDDEIIIESFDGERKVILNSAVPIFNEQNAIQGVVVVNQDITRRRQMEQELIQTNELLNKYFNSMHTLIAYLDRDFNFLRVNEAYANSAGHPAEFFPGKNHFELYPHAENQQIFLKVVESGEAFSVSEKPFEYPEYPERGVSYWDWSLEPVKSRNGAVEGLVLSLVDVTERKHAKLQLEKQNQELRELSAREYQQRLTAEGLTQSIVKINSSLELSPVLGSILEIVRQLIPFQGGHILLLDGKTLTMASCLGYENYEESLPVLEQPHELEDFPLLTQLFTDLQPVIIDQVDEYPGWIKVPGLEWIQSYVAVPMIYNHAAIGVLTLVSEIQGAFPTEIIEWLQNFTAPAALALHNARLYQAEMTSRKVAETLSASAQALTRTLDLEQLFETLLDQIQTIIPSDTAAITLLENEKFLAVRARRGYGKWANRNDIPAFPVEGITDSVIKRITVTHRSFTLPNTLTSSPPENQPGLELYCNWLIIPIIAGDKVIGLVELGKVGEAKFLPELIRWAEAIVDQASMAIQNAWLFRQVRASSERLQSLTRKLVEVQESERYRIARLLHDDAGQALSVFKLNLGRLEQAADCPDHVRQRLNELKNEVDQVLENLHSLAVDLRPITLDHLGLVAALEQYARNFHSERYSVQFKAIGFEGNRLPKDLETCFYRIAQEALTNIERHSNASNIGILLERREDKVKLFVEDDGIGFDPKSPASMDRLGLSSMRERAEMFGGTLNIESIPGSGTSIIVEVPDAHSHFNRR